jgi:hypothetical protein
MSVRSCVADVSMSLGLVVLVAGSVSAQATVPAHSLRGLLGALGDRVNDAVLTPLVAPPVVPDPSEPAAGTDIVALLTSLEVSTTPFGTSTGSFTFTFDSQLGTFTRSTRSFGPAFGKRSTTNGKGKASAGFNWLHAGYDSLGGLALTNGDLRPVQNARGMPPPQSEDDLLALTSYTSLRMNLTSDTYVGFGAYGLTNNLDVGAAIPWVRVSLGADVGLFKATDEDITPGKHAFVMPTTTASGLGDVAIFGKYRVWHQGDGGLAAEVEVRLPTGDTNSLRGTGVTRTLVSAIWSHGGTLSPHAHVGFEFWSRGIALHASGTPSVKDQINYALGLEILAHPRATVMVDVIGRRLLGGGQLAYRTETIKGTPVKVDRLTPTSKALDVVSLAPGIKWNVAGNVLLTGSVLASITNKGLRANAIPVVGVDWAF